ncbi:MAG: hypothetical protein Q7S89_00330, partial [bacterium]|nr:hypothetical protein [bacterium]
AIAGLLMWYGGELPTSSFPAVNLTAEQRNLLALVNYVNAKGQEWSIPTGEYAFNVSSKPTQYPRFISGDIDPLDVKVGDTQRMTIVVVDIASPKQVWAEIEHDAGKDTVQLSLTGTKAVAREELERRPYLVDESGKLILNDASNRISVKSVVEKFIARADAAGEAAYTYEGSWVVHDTHTKTYRTTFVAESQAGRRDEYALAWSDPVCRFFSNGFLQESCNPGSGNVEGFDGATAYLGSFSINLGANAHFVFNSGTSIDLSGGAKFGDQTNIANGATIEKGYIYYSDGDGDGYTTSVQRYYFSTPSQSLYVRAQSVNGATDPSNAQVPITANLDCYDSGTNAQYAFPGQTNFVSSVRGDGSWDFNCSGALDSLGLFGNHGFPPTYSSGAELAPGWSGLCTVGPPYTAAPAISTNCGVTAGGSGVGWYRLTGGFPYVQANCRTDLSQVYAGQIIQACK